MTLRHNIIASYIAQIYVMTLGIVMVPLYIKFMGAEAYGLVGFFSMLQSWFQLLDMGLTPTISRETARFRGGQTKAEALRRLLRSLEGIFCVVAFVGALIVIVAAPSISTHWLNVKTLSLHEVEVSLILMALVIALRWICGLYRGVITGFERLVWLNVFNSFVATFRFVVVIPLFIFVGKTPSQFFAFQFVVAVAELAVLMFKTYRLCPPLPTGTSKLSPLDAAPLRGLVKFSLSAAFTSSIWVLVTQTDKLILSKLLPLDEYAYFTLAVLVSGGVMVLSGPISSAIVPRLTHLHAINDMHGFVSLYRKATQLVCSAVIPASLVLALFSGRVLWALTGKEEIGTYAADVLSLYALGNGVLAIAAFPSYIQYATGDMRLHVIGNAIFVLLLIPAITFATWKFGAIGAGYAWLSANVLYFVFWVPLVHRRFIKGIHPTWLVRDVGRSLILSVAITFVLWLVVTSAFAWPQSRVGTSICLVLIGLVSLSISLLGSTWVTEFLSNKRLASSGATGGGSN
jgi:O-antigen/teichoic acid export membrane protein